MLVLTRKSNQSIMIGDDIEVSVLSIMGEKVRIGIQAPRDIPVFRKEVYLEIQEERGEVVATAAAHPGASETTAAAGGDAGRSLRAEVDRELRELGNR
jgi:carbon storage regulator